MDNDAVKNLAGRVGKLEREQELMRSQVVGKLDALANQLDGAIVDMKVNNRRVDDHDKRLTVRETAWKEQTFPALERLRHLELKVAGSAVLGGAVMYLGTEALKALSRGGL